MSAPDYSREAVLVFVDKGIGGGFWRASCPVDCGWHGSDYVTRKEAETWRDFEKKQHECLRTPVAPEPRPTLRATEEGEG